MRIGITGDTHGDQAYTQIYKAKKMGFDMLIVDHRAHNESEGDYAGFGILDRFDVLCNDITEGLPAEIEARQKQYEYYRDKLLAFKEIQ